MNLIGYLQFDLAQQNSRMSQQVVDLSPARIQIWPCPILVNAPCVKCPLSLNCGHKKVRDNFKGGHNGGDDDDDNGDDDDDNNGDEDEDNDDDNDDDNHNDSK